MNPAFALLMLAIVIEVGASSALPRAEGFTNPWWTVIVVSGYVAAIWLLTVVVQHIPVSIAYAVWSGVGTAAIAVIGYFYLGEDMSTLKVGALAMIVIGVVLLNLQTTSH